MSRTQKHKVTTAFILEFFTFTSVILPIISDFYSLSMTLKFNLTFSSSASTSWLLSPVVLTTPP